jgi:hypothetical protein
MLPLTPSPAPPHPPLQGAPPQGPRLQTAALFLRQLQRQQDPPSPLGQLVARVGGGASILGARIVADDKLRHTNPIDAHGCRYGSGYGLVVLMMLLTAAC